jgi:hypothetical protein
VDERRGRHGVAWAHGKLTARSAPKLMVNEWKDLIECFAATGPEIRKQRCYAGCGISGRERAFDRAFVIQHRWQRPNVDIRGGPAPTCIAVSDRRLRLSVEPFIAND